jgi:sugar phosphate isomerase/epimerase
MLISTQIEDLGSRIGYDNAVEVMGKIGFDAYDFSMFDSGHWNPTFTENWQAYLDSALAKAKTYGMICDQAHGPMVGFVSEDPQNDERDQRAFGVTTHSIRCAGYLGAKAIVIHPIYFASKAEDRERCKKLNIKFYNSLLPYAKEAGVKIALENMMQPDPALDSAGSSPACFCELLDALDPAWFTACLDIGHAYVCGYDPAEFIRALGHDRLTTLHVHDNDRSTDQHFFPYQGKVDWDSVCRALVEIDYQGTFNLEAVSALDNYPTELFYDAYVFLKKTADYLVAKIESYRTK